VEDTQPLPGRLGARHECPFQWVKTIASHYGGTATGCHLLAGAHQGPGGDPASVAPRDRHVPTLLEATGIEQPSMVNGVAQKPIEGVSMAYSFNDPKAPSTTIPSISKSSPTAPSIMTAGWPAPRLLRRDLEDQTKFKRVDVIDGYTWELYNVDNDFSEAVNLADKYPDKLRDLQLLFYAEAPNTASCAGRQRTERLDPATRPSLHADARVHLHRNC